MNVLDIESAFLRARPFLKIGEGRVGLSYKDESLNREVYLGFISRSQAERAFNILSSRGVSRITWYRMDK